jgi:hypothetical protein
MNKNMREKNCSLNVTDEYVKSVKTTNTTYQNILTNVVSGV